MGVVPLSSKRLMVLGKAVVSFRRCLALLRDARHRRVESVESSLWDAVPTRQGFVCSILGLYRDNGKGNGNYSNIRVV